MADIVKSEARPIAYTYHDARLDEDFPVYQGHQDVWWVKDRTKLNLFFGAIKSGSTVNIACYQAGITRDQYEYFREQHPWFSALIRMYREMVPAKLKEIVLRAALGDGDKEKPNAKMALGALKYFNIPESDPDIAPPQTIPGGLVAKHVTESIIEDAGGISISRETKEVSVYGEGNHHA